ncbi:hypothetical protein HanRHA438_Chr11g0489701 [Helianthus annuus]|nr:hypothetical protein HanRHA438_Chr11g0489701 [Helianthus annuus]
MKIHCDNHCDIHCFDFLCSLWRHSQQKTQFWENCSFASCFSANTNPSSAGTMSD